MMTFNLFDLFIILLVATMVFSLLQGYMGNLFKNMFKFILAEGVFEYVVFVVLLLVFLLFFSDTVYAMGVDGNDTNLPKADVNVSDTNINIHNPNISVPADSLVKGLTNVGGGCCYWSWYECYC